MDLVLILLLVFSVERVELISEPNYLTDLLTAQLLLSGQDGLLNSRVYNMDTGGRQASSSSSRRLPGCFLNENDRLPWNLASVVANPKDFLSGPLSRDRRNRVSQRHFIVVGGGISGLLSSYLLLEVGHRVTVLESSTRRGGRVYTFYGRGYYGDLGAFRFQSVHVVLQAMFRHFDIPTANFTSNNQRPGSYFFLNNKYYPYTDFLGPNPNPTSLRELYSAYRITNIPTDGNGTILSPMAVMEKYDEKRTVDLCRNDRSILEVHIEKLREDNLDERIALLRNVILGITVFEGSSYAEQTGDNDDDVLEERFPGPQVEVINGSSVIVERVFRRLAGHSNFVIRMSSPVTRVVQDDRGVTVHYTSGSRTQSVTGSYAILTPTMRAMETIQFQPDLDQRKRDGFRRYTYFDAMKIYLKFREAFWSFGRDRGNRAPPIPYGPTQGGGTGGFDSKIGQVFYPSYDFHGPVLLAAYNWGAHTTYFHGLTRQECVQYAINQLIRVHGEIVRDYFEEGVVYIWTKNRHTRGAFVHEHPMEKYLFMEHIQRRHDRVFFSGEFANKKNHGYIESAVEAAIRTLVNLWPDAYNRRYGREERQFFNRPGRMAVNSSSNGRMRRG